MSALEGHLQRLNVPHPAIQQAAVAGVFDTIGKAANLPAASKSAAVVQCLASGHKAVVEAAVHALNQLAGGSRTAAVEVHDHFMTALSMAGTSTAAALADGLLQLFEHQLETRPASNSASSWRNHLLVKAVMCNTAVGQPLVLGVARLLTRACDSARASVDEVAGAMYFTSVLAALRPFISFVLLDPHLAARQPLLPLHLRSSLARVACCCSRAPIQFTLLQLLSAYIPAMRLPLPASGAEVSSEPQLEAAASTALAEVLDVMESCDEEPGATDVSALVANLISLSHDALRAQACALLQQLVAALSHLAAYWPQLVLPHTVDLATPLLQQPGVGAVGNPEAKAVLVLLRQLLQHAAMHADPAEDAARPKCHQMRQVAALLLLPLLQQVTFSSSQGLKSSAGHALALLQQLSSSNVCIGPADANVATPHSSLQSLLCHFWRQPLEARHWLASLQLSLASTAGRATLGSSRSGSSTSKGLLQLHESTLLVTCALLQHPAEAVQHAALSAATAAVAVAPLLGLSLLPLLVHRLQQQVELVLSGKQPPSHLFVELLRALTAAGSHPATLPFVLRVLQPLLSSGSHELLQAASLRLLCRLWRSSGGRVYQQLRAAVIGFAAPGQQPGLALRVARAECLRDIAANDADKAVELVGLVQECLGDEAPSVQAIGLECVALLCEADVLEFYAAWSVVHRTLPRLPEHPLTAAAWVRLLGYGALDAAVQPDAAAAIIDALWLAGAHDAPQVRYQAYASLAAFQLETLEDIGALRPLCAYASLLHAERQQQQQAALNSDRSRRQQRAALQAATECEALVKTTLSYEHATRRRSSAAGAAGKGPGRARVASGMAAGGTTAATMAHRLQSVLPKQLLGGPTTAASDLLQRLPDLSPVAVLYLYAPPPPAAGSVGKAASSAAQQAAAAYEAVFVELVRQQSMASTVAAAAADAGAAADLLAAWAAFSRRWLAAVRAASSDRQLEGQQSTDKQLANTAAALQVWEAIKQQLKSRSSTTAAAASSAAWAAAALCTCAHQPLPPLVMAAHGALLSVASPDAQQPAAVKRAALAALGATAGAVRVTLGTPALQQLLQLMQQHLLGSEESAAGLAEAGAGASGLGLACIALSSMGAAAERGSGSSLPAAAEQMLTEVLTSLLSVFSSLWPAVSAISNDNAHALGVSLPPCSQRSGSPGAEELLPIVIRALEAALPATAAALPTAGLLQQLHQQVSATLFQRTHAAEVSPTAAAALCALLQAVATTAYRTGILPSSGLSSTLRLLFSLAGSESSTGQAATVDGRMTGAAGAGAGRLLSAVLQQGFTPAAVEESPTAVLQLLSAALEAAVRHPHAAAAKQGAAAGIAALLLDGSVDPASTDYKAAVGLLESLSLKDSDPRVRRACAAMLAALCHAAKRGGSHGGSAVASAAPSGIRSLAQLQPDGALRPLLESLLDGRWAIPEESNESAAGQELSPADAAAILRCLAAAERLPAMNYSALCRRLLRSCSAPREMADEVKHAVVTFVAAHGSRQQQQYHLAELAAELLSQHNVAAAAGPAGQHLLLHMPQLLASLPESQAVSTLQAVCHHIASTAANQRLLLLLPLLQALEQLLGGASSNITSPRLQQAAQQAVTELVLPLLPVPGAYPLHPTAARQAAAAALDGLPGEIGQQQQPSSVQQRCWTAALRCLQLLPPPQLEDLLCQPLLLQQLPLHAVFATSALVAAGTLDSSALQHPRNLLLIPAGAASGSSLSGKQQVRLAAFVSRAVATLPAAQQRQWLLDALDACKVCASPAGPFQLAINILAISAAAAATTEQLATDHSTIAGPTDAVIHSLPHSLALLLSSPAWQHGGMAPLLLEKLAAALQAMTGQPMSEEAAQLDAQQLLRRCLLAARHSLPADMWQLLANLL